MPSDDSTRNDRGGPPAVAAISAPIDQTKSVFPAVPSQAIAAAWSLATNGVTAVTFGWHATDASGMVRYNVSLRANGGAWYDYTSSLASAAAESLTFNLSPGVKYELAVIAQDKAGNWSDWRYGVPVTPGITAENGTGVAYYGGSWTRVTNTSAVGRAYTTGATTNAYAEHPAASTSPELSEELDRVPQWYPGDVRASQPIANALPHDADALSSPL